METKLLTLKELQDSSHLIPDWEILNSRIRKTFQFRNFIDAFGFMTKVAIIADGMGHHPEWKNVYSKVTIDLTTHELNGISNLDLKLAKSIDEIIRKNP